MPFTGNDFYIRLKEVCSKNGTNVSSFLTSLGKSSSAGAYMQRKATPDGQIAAIAAERFNVSTEYLLGLSDDPSTLSHDSLKLTHDDIKLITALHEVSKPIRDMVMRIAFSTLSDLTSSSVFSSPKGIHVTQEKKPDPVFATNPKLRQLGVSKGAHAVAYRKVEGMAAAGAPRAAVREDDRQIVVPVKYIGEQYFIVQAEGDSMTGIVNDGDFCVFDKHGHFDNGRVCLVQADGATDEPDAMIKRVFRRGDRVELRSENRKYPPRFYPVEEVVLMGELVKVLPPESCMPPSR